MPETVADIPEMSADLNERPKVEGRGGLGSTFRRKPALGVMLCLFAGGLSACQDAPSEQDQAVSYPSLHTVPSAPRPSTSVEERRQIVQDLIKERNDSLRQTGVVRHRSGLDYSLPEAASDPDWDPETIVPEEADQDGDPFRLTAEGRGGAGSTYRSDTRFKDGGLDDFIRDMRRETSPGDPGADEVLEPESTTNDGAIPNDAPRINEADDDVSSVFPPQDLGSSSDDPKPVLLAAFAPALTERPIGPSDIVIRLAAEEEDKSFFCWGPLEMVFSFTGACAVENGEGGDENANTAQDDNDAASQDGNETASEGQSSSDEEQGDKSLTVEEAEQAIEEGEGVVVASPIGRSLAKLRDFVRGRRGEDIGPSPRQVPPFRADAVRESPPIPKSRPERLKPIEIEDQGETFWFDRTHKPHFKPARNIVIHDPESGEAATSSSLTSSNTERQRSSGEGRSEENRTTTRKTTTAAGSGGPKEPAVATQSSTEAPASPTQTTSKSTSDEKQALDAAVSGETVPQPSEPAISAKASEAKPKAPPTSNADTPTEKATVGQIQENEAASDEDLAIAELGADIDEPGLSARPYIIPFEPESDRLPEGSKLQLIAILAKAKAYDQKLHIIGQASTNHLARERAVIVGAELVRLGATAEILEYDHNAITGVDQVKLVIRPIPVDPTLSKRSTAQHGS